MWGITFPKTSNNHVEKQKKCAGGKEEKWKKLQNVKRRLRMRRRLLVSLMTMAWQFSDCQTIVSYRPKLDSTLVVVVECTRGHWGDSSPTTKQSQTQVCGGQKREGPESSLRCPERVSVLSPEFIYVQSLCINSGQPTTLCLFVRESNSAVCPFVSLDNQLGWVELTISWGTSLNSTPSHSFTMGMARAMGPTVTSAEEGVCQCAIVIMCQSKSINVPKYRCVGVPWHICACLPICYWPASVQLVTHVPAQIAGVFCHLKIPFKCHFCRLGLLSL